MKTYKVHDKAVVVVLTRSEAKALKKRLDMDSVSGRKPIALQAVYAKLIFAMAERKREEE
jgi:hypothetical protein